MKLKLIAFAVIILTALNSCKKDITTESAELQSTALVEKFFSSTKPLPTEIEEIKKQLRLENTKYNFIPRMIQLSGFPQWEKALIRRKNDASISNVLNNSASGSNEYIIPTVGTVGEMVMGAITIQPDNPTPYHLLLLNDFAQHGIQKEQFLIEMMFLNNHVFGNDKFRILNNSLPNTQEVLFKPKANSNSFNSSSSSNVDEGCYEMEIWHNPNGDANNNDGDEYYTGVDYWVGNCPQQTTSIILPSGGGGGNGLPPYYYPLLGLPGGGGGNPIPPIPYYPIPTTIEQKTSYLIQHLNLSLAQQSNLTLYLNEADINILFEYSFNQNSSTANNYAIWVLDFLANNPTNSFKNVFYAYQTKVESEVTNPCIQSVISNIGEIGCSSALLKLYQSKSFTQNSAYKIKFKQDASLIGNSGQQVYGKTDPIVTLPNGKKEITIHLNTTLLSSTAKEFIATTIVHEITHSLYSIQFPTSTESQQHLGIFQAGDAIPIAQAVQEIYPSLSNVDAVALALQGLDEITFPNGIIDLDRNAYAEQNYGMGVVYARNKAFEYINGTQGTPC